MTKEKAMEILGKAFNSIFGEISFEIAAKRSSVVEEILLARDVETIRHLVNELDAIDKTLSDIDRCKDAVNVCITDKDKWHSRHLLSDLNKAFSLLPPKDEAN